MCHRCAILGLAAALTLACGGSSSSKNSRGSEDAGSGFGDDVSTGGDQTTGGRSGTGGSSGGPTGGHEGVTGGSGGTSGGSGGGVTGGFGGLPPVDGTGGLVLTGGSGGLPGTGGTGGLVLTGGSGGLPGTGGTGGLVLTGGSGGFPATGGTADVDPRCLARQPTESDACTIESLRCTYSSRNGCLCEAIDMYTCPQADPNCPSVSSDVAGFAPPAGGAGGSQSTAPMPPVYLCVCSASHWRCTFYGF